MIPGVGGPFIRSVTMKNKAFNEFLLSFALLLTSCLILFIPATLDWEPGPVGISSMIIGAKQLFKKAGKKGYSIAAVIGGCLLTTFYLVAILEMMFVE